MSERTYLPDLDVHAAVAHDLRGELVGLEQAGWVDSMALLDAAEVEALRDWLTAWLERQ